jgi:hypothetical protein
MTKRLSTGSELRQDAMSIRCGKCFLSVGHDEYWSREMYGAVKDAIDCGVNVAFLSGNTCCFVTPFSPSSAGQPNRTITRAGRYGGVAPAERDYMGPFRRRDPMRRLSSVPAP